MKTPFLFTAVALLAAWNFFFWHEAPGINVLLFSLLLMGALFFLYPECRWRKTVWLAAAGVLLTGAMVVLHGPGWSVFAHLFSVAVFAAMMRAKALRSVLSMLLQAFADQLQWPLVMLMKLRSRARDSTRLRKTLSFSRIVVLPLLVACLFFALYSFGSPHFAEMNRGLLDRLGDLLREFSGAHFFFVVAGGWLIAGLLLWSGANLLTREDAKPGDMVRIRRKIFSPAGMLALKRELRAGVVLLVLLNVLLLAVNFIDVQKVWVDFVVPEKFSLKQFVHSGTWVLIACILLSMMVLLWLFRGNMHFFRENRPLKLLAYAWIAQNIFLALSVYMRNSYYIGHHGLAYGRIGIIAFIALVIFGLVTLFIKVRNDKSPAFLLRINSLAVYLLIAGMSLVNWDTFIVRNNLAHPNPSQIDVDFYLQVSPNAFPEVIAGKEQVYNQISAHSTNSEKWIEMIDRRVFEEELAGRTTHYLEKRSRYSWLSWNFADARAEKFFCFPLIH
jgi:hypothetical protein